MARFFFFFSHESTYSNRSKSVTLIIWRPDCCGQSINGTKQPFAMIVYGIFNVSDGIPRKI